MKVREEWRIWPKNAHGPDGGKSSGSSGNTSLGKTADQVACLTEGKISFQS